MKNSNLFKKFAVMVVSAMMVLTSFAMPTFAADDTTIKVSGLPASGVAVKAYKIVKQDSNGNWLSIDNDAATFGTESKAAIADVAKPTANEILALAERTDLVKAADLSYDSASEKWTADLKDTENKYGVSDTKGQGMYLVLVENTAGQDGKLVNADESGMVRVYNPMIVSIYSDNATGDLAAGDVNPVNDSFEQIGADNSKTEVYAKSSTPDFDKYIIRDKDDTDTDKANFADANKTDHEVSGTNAGNANTRNENKYGDTDSRGSDANNPKVGDEVWFEIASTIPAYADNYFYTDSNNVKHFPTFKIYDTLSTGLILNAKGENGAFVADKLKVYAGTPLAELPKTQDGKDNWTITFDSENASYVIQFTENYLKTRVGVQTKIAVKYSATVGQLCAENFAPETNTAKIKYSHKPGDDSGYESEEITTYHYTFSINGKINGEGSQDLREVVKVGSSKDGSFVFKETEKKSTDNAWVEDIEGAVFELFKADTSKDPWEKADNNVIRTATSDKDGRLMGLDRLDAGNYVLVEKSVPQPYSKKTTAIPVAIEASLKDNGQLETYKITIGGVVAGNYKATYDTNNNITKIEALADNDSVLGTYTAPETHTNDEVITKYSVVPKRANESDEAYAARIAQYVSTFDDVHPEAADIRNTKTAELPSTGGMGTVIFTVGGIAIMALALFLLFGGKKRKEQE